jgi:hypothetical protein
MLLRLVALGAAGYAGYKYLTRDGLDDNVPLPDEGRQVPGENLDAEPEVALAGGPLSREARVVHNDEGSPAG